MMAQENEKTEVFSTNGPRQHEPPRRKGVITAILIVMATLWYFHFNAPSTFEALQDDRGYPSGSAEQFDWAALKTSKHLDYQPCYGHRQCARLELPMDWFNETTNATISLAVIRQPAVVPITHPQYGGAILLNPGGPGGSGIGLLLRSGEFGRSVLDTNTTDGKYFDLVSFDPRGVGLSEPMVDCSHNPILDASWQLRVLEEGWLDSSDAALGRLWSMSLAKQGRCSLPHGDEGEDIKKYVSTASAARDMLELVERHGEWREKEANSLLQNTRPWWSFLNTGCSKQSEVPSSLRFQPGKERIQYWGFSYGTYLGGTFAAMFPDRVERLVVDGVVQYENYVSGNWSSNLADTEKTMDSFYFHCARVGYPGCSLANETGQNTPTDIKNRSLDIIQSLYHNPLPVTLFGADVLSYSEVRSLIFSALYAPIEMFPLISNLLLAIETRNETALSPLLQVLHPSVCEASGPAFAMQGDATTAIACSDADDQSYLDRNAFQSFARELAAISPSSGSLWSIIRMSCIHYTLPAVHRFTGPWKANTSHPLLFIGNTADPVTPGKFAHQMSKGFDGAVALTQDSGGHCSQAAFSKCTTGYVRKYFQTGELPPANTTCAADVLPFGPTPGDVVVEDEEMKTAQAEHGRFAEAILEHGAGFLGGHSLTNARKALAQL